MPVLSEIGVDIEAYTAGCRGAGLPMMLDLVCGAKKVPGPCGIDVGALPGVDLVHDPEAVPYPLPESLADAVSLNDVLEHFKNPLRVLEEIWRLARPNARVYIQTPHSRESMRGLTQRIATPFPRRHFPPSWDFMTR